MGKTNIGWTEYSLNFIKWWCTKVSEGCRFCYMMTLARQYPQHAADHPVWRDKASIELVKLPAGAECFVGDMYDIFHEQMPAEFIYRHFSLLNQRPDCTFLLLTKRPERALAMTELVWPDWIWMGTSIENRKRLGRLDVLKQLPARHKFLSIEPLLEDIGEADFRGIDSVIVGGESGSERRPFDPQWARNIREQCQRDGVPFYLKQGGARFPGLDRELDGLTYDDLAWRKPAVEFPQQASLF